MQNDATGTACFLQQFKPLIHRTLKRLNVTPQHMDYEDYYQELQIKLLEILQKFKNDSADEEEKNCKFTAYAGQGLYWHGLDLLRAKENHSLETVEASTMDWIANQEDDAEITVEADLYTSDFFRLAKERLSEKDYQLLLQLAEDQYTMQELADEYGVVRATIYQWKNKIQVRLQDLKDCLID